MQQLRDLFIKVHAKLLNLKIYPKSKHRVSICPHGKLEWLYMKMKYWGAKEQDLRIEGMNRNKNWTGRSIKKLKSQVTK